MGVTETANSRSSASGSVNAIKRTRSSIQELPALTRWLSYIVFDILYLDGPAAAAVLAKHTATCSDLSAKAKLVLLSVYL